ncbi:hypothetical protein [Virgibacillus dokdonensis]|uniref:hypothetical protein n=1 Tax=Virgibacillus dokdonensis TaxID=302167 RepID=UPI000C7D78C2|nr:hypothetical protein [Virgibacillus dokdonensis]
MHLLKWLIVINIGLISFVVGCFFTYLLIVNSSMSLKDTSLVTTIISSGGNIFGGLVGGIVAFGVARAQFLNDASTETKNKRQIYLNLLMSLKIELKHNKQILKIILTNGSDQDKYVKSLKTDAWDKAKYNSNNFFPVDIYELLDIHNQDIKDIREGILPDYKIDEVDFKMRLDVTCKLISKIEEEESKYRKLIR